MANIAVHVVSGNPDTTFTLTSTNTAQAIASGKITIDDVKAKSAFITFENNDVRIGFNTASTSLGHILKAEEAVLLESFEAITKFKFISKTADNHSVLQISIFF